MYGAILGDIIGSPYEFDQGNKVKDFPLFSEESEFTDDTVMTIAVAEAFMDAPTDGQQIRERLIRTLHKYGKAFPDAGYGSRFGMWLFLQDSEPYGSYGNGSAMRVSPVAWIYQDLPAVLEAAKRSAEVTHNHPEGIKGAQATAAAIFLARTGSTKAEIRTFVEETFGYDLRRTCDEIRPGYHHVESCQETVPEAITAFLEGESFEDVMRAWDATARQLIRIGVTLDNCADMIVEQEVPDILCSALVDDCIERGLHLKEGGAHYDIVSQLQVGNANLGDSLAALKKLVYEEKKIGRNELWKALMDDFAGEEGKRIQRMLQTQAPKFGNDDDYVDKLILQAYDTYLDEIQNYRNTRYGRGPIGGGYFAGTSSVAANVPQGAGTCATPDGRNKGEPLAEGCSPAHGRDKNGPTSVFKSISKLPTKEIFGGVLLNQKVVPALLERQEDREKLQMLIRTFFDILHGWHVQYNVVSRETLLDAQAHPEKYPDLIVRVAGYSAFFHVLSPQTQNDIIWRTEQTI
jgi:autonomous glycyl radical cofactor GrcA